MGVGGSSLKALIPLGSVSGRPSSRRRLHPEGPSRWGPCDVPFPVCRALPTPRPSRRRFLTGPPSPTSCKLLAPGEGKPRRKCFDSAWGEEMPTPGLLSSSTFPTRPLEGRPSTEPRVSWNCEGYPPTPPRSAAAGAGGGGGGAPSSPDPLPRPASHALPGPTKAPELRPLWRQHAHPCPLCHPDPCGPPLERTPAGPARTFSA